MTLQGPASRASILQLHLSKWPFSDDISRSFHPMAWVFFRACSDQSALSFPALPFGSRRRGCLRGRTHKTQHFSTFCCFRGERLRLFSLVSEMTTFLRWPMASSSVFLTRFFLSLAVRTTLWESFFFAWRMP